MGDVDDAHDPEYQREPGGDEEKQQAVLNAVQQLNQECIEVHYILQAAIMVGSSSSAFTAMPVTRFSLPATLRRYWSWIGLCALDSVIVPRGLSIFAFSIALIMSAFRPISPFTAFIPASKSRPESYPATAYTSGCSLKVLA